MSHSHADHSHSHSHGHSHSHSHAPPNVSGRAMGAAVTLTLAFVAVEAAAGWLAHSLALVSDAGHNLADAAALGFSWYALAVALAGIVINLTVGLWLHSGSKDDLNVRSAYLHMMGDALSAFGVVIAGVLVAEFGLSLAD